MITDNEIFAGAKMLDILATINNHDTPSIQDERIALIIYKWNLPENEN